MLKFKEQFLNTNQVFLFGNQYETLRLSENSTDSDKERIVFCLPEVRIVGGLLLDIMIRDIHKKRCKGFFDVLREKCFYFYEKRAEVARDNLVNYAKNKTNAKFAGQFVYFETEMQLIDKQFASKN